MQYNDDIRELQKQVALYEDKEAYKKLFYMLFPSLQNFSYSILKSRLLAEETVSDVFIHIWEKRNTLLEIENIRLYLFVSVKNASLRKLQQEKKKHQQVSFDDLHVEFISDYCTPEEIAQSSQTEKIIHSTVQNLPSRCKLIFKLAKEDHLKYKEIAALLHISIKTIDAQLTIALKKIAVALSQKSHVKKNN
jgi:RNA polymerase sigma-70 factor (family 1)